MVDKIILVSAVTKRSQSLTAAATFLQNVVDQSFFFQALVGASIGALAVYDMLKGLSHDITIEDTKLIFKSGGKRFYDRHRDEIKNKTRPV